MDFFDSLYETNSDRTTFESITMWEALRIPYNILLALSMFILFGIVNFTVGDSLDAMLPFAFLLLCNFFYTFSWVTELLLPAKTVYSQKVFFYGLAFSLFWIFLLALLHIVLWAGRGFKPMEDYDSQREAHYIPSFSNKKSTFYAINSRFYKK
jgi:hypothetical protein